MKENGKRWLKVLITVLLLAILPALISSASSFGGFISWLLFFSVIVFLYFLPTINAYIGEKKNAMAIGVLNFLLGWTFIGWIVALVWSFTKD